MTPLAMKFARFAEVECTRSPLYRTLATAISTDDDLLQLAAAAPPDQPTPNLFLAAVHFLLLTSLEDSLSQYYPSLGGSRSHTEAFDPFKTFATVNESKLLEALRSRRVQTNEVARGAILLPGLIEVARRSDRALALIEVGARAGLLLLFDRYEYDYGKGMRAGAPGSGVQIACEARGQRALPLMTPGPAIATRVGVDVNPINLQSTDDALWLRALVWPDQLERAARLSAAISIAQQTPIQLIAGDANDVLPDLLAKVPAQYTACVFHCHTLNQFSQAQRTRFTEILTHASAGRDIFHLASEGAGTDSVMTLRRLRNGSHIEEVPLADYQGHGNWIAWRA